MCDVLDEQTGARLAHDYEWRIGYLDGALKSMWSCQGSALQAQKTGSLCLGCLSSVFVLLMHLEGDRLDRK